MQEVSKLPNFREEYETWYSEALALIKQILPDRLEDFVALYERPKNRKITNQDNYVIQDFLQGTTVYIDGDRDSLRGVIAPFEQQAAILRATSKRFESSLFEIRQLVQADLFDSELDAARELLRHKFLRAAGAIAGVVLEGHLLQVCKDHDVAVQRKHPGISALNDALKDSHVIDTSQWRFIGMLADIRNVCDHNKDIEPTGNKVNDLIDGADKVVRTVV